MNIKSDEQKKRGRQTRKIENNKVHYFRRPIDSQWMFAVIRSGKYANCLYVQTSNSPLKLRIRNGNEFWVSIPKTNVNILFI